MSTNKLSRLATAICAITLPTMAVAQGNALEEIVVTAQKRTQNVQDVPIAITALSEKMIERIGGNTLTDIENFAPSLNFGRGSRRTRGEINIRGVGSFSRNPGFDARTSVYIDGVFLGRSGSFDADLQGIESVEILRGPQGTLFGINTIAGAVSINTRKPTEESEASLMAEVGNYNYTKFQGYVSGPLGEGVSGSLALTKMDQDGFIDNIFLNEDLNGVDRISGRAKLRFQPSDNLDINLSADYLDENAMGTNGEGHIADSGVGGVFGGASFTAAPNPREVSHDAMEQEDREFWGVSAQVDYEMDSGLTLTSISAYRELDWYNLNEEDYTNVFVGITNFNETTDQFTQEFRVTSTSDGNFDWVAGLYYIQQDISTDRDGIFTGLFFGRAPEDSERIPTIVDVDATGYAAYINGNYRLTDAFEITAGLRYSYDEKEINFFLPNPTGFAGVLDMTGQPPYEDKYDANDLTPRVGLNWRPSDGTLVYASYAAGFKSGGFNVDFVQSLAELPYDEETADSYELGLKTEFFDSRARLNLALFHTTFEDFQVQQFQRISETVSRISISNAAEARSQGLEAEFTLVPVEGLTLQANGAYIDAEFEDFKECNAGVDCTGNKLPYAPEFKFFVSAEYAFNIGEGDAYARYDFTYTDGYFTHPENTPQVREVDSWETHNARVGYTLPGGNWEFSLWGKNLTDEDALRMAEINFFGTFRGTYIPPRTYGASVRYNMN